MTTLGTSHFVSRAHANLYYRAYGLDSDAVGRKIAAGEIHIGQPAVKVGDTLSIIPIEGRYQITKGGAA